ncbi:I78 family peptidase inhibitor [Pseudomonas sp. 7P_10.2_Bac1]|uniref:I78 family peptidase inhibitor n=1 Tax=Pseudomonas sp. 7P_10.2_Bac1 TaxID=2971614 RepID=UPI0021C661FC|nr:I78 family peptidase inhibitor [Pseudomonas sp. 7P_10.2_Bac1]MCU1725460.1 I78 family peptidase inhibitor [Pseudomonas sp. 7P_10.2_Bac1]
MSWKLASLGSLLAVVVLSGCSSTQEAAKEPVVDAGHTRCDAKGADFAIGQKASSSLLEQARVKAGAQTARILGPHDMITLEYRSDRLNLNADDSGVITRVNCG